MLGTALFSSRTCEWETPQDLFDQLDELYGPFTLDVCATRKNSKCTKYYDIGDNGLTREWSGHVWMNPPYGREVAAWVHKARILTEAGKCKLVCCLLPARTDTGWWHDEVEPYGQVQFLRGRLKFGGSKNAAPFPSAIVVFRAR